MSFLFGFDPIGTIGAIVRICAITALAAAVSAPSARAEIAPNAESIRPILIGSPVPDAEVRTIDGDALSIADAVAGRVTVLVFFRGGWCPFCDTQLAGLRDIAGPLAELGVDLVAVGGDSPERLRVTRESGEIDYTLLSDFDLHAAEAFGLAFRVAESYIKRLGDFGLDIEGNSASVTQALPVPSVFVVDESGTITFSYVNPNYKIRCDPDVILAAARAAAKSP